MKNNLEDDLRQCRHDLRERTKELQCIYGISSIVEDETLSLDEMLSRAVQFIPPAWQYPETTCARIVFNGRIYGTANFQNTRWKQSAAIVVHGKEHGTLEVCYLEERPQSDEGPFLKEERNLINGLSKWLGQVIQRKEAEDANRIYQDELRSMVSQLSLAEHRERLQISTELHDSIAQPLAMAKVRLGELQAMAESLDQKRISEDIRQLVEQTIHSVRSLSFALSPPVLYELGFEPAVEWLAEQVESEHKISVTFETDAKNKAIEPSLRVLLFTMVRELLQNVVKHSRARNAWISIRREDSRLIVQVRDDGCGFDA
ncbi:MAG TPA: histidine kinase, partial [Acidobacteriota bacterium]